MNFLKLIFKKLSRLSKRLSREDSKMKYEENLNEKIKQQIDFEEVRQAEIRKNAQIKQREIEFEKRRQAIQKQKEYQRKRLKEINLKKKG